jgi:UDP-N-acetylglucosamine--N-acetylmuramyl-(pentapeptide) pyrophosphoryl-undecaprenol N-acetylglucosamine transferase
MPRVELTGNPLRRNLETGNCLTMPAEFSAERPMRILVLGGSLGSLPLNRGVPVSLGGLTEEQKNRIQVFHQCGEQHLETTQQAYWENRFAAVEIHPFVDDMKSAYAAADLVICRAGALTVLPQSRLDAGDLEGFLIGYLEAPGRLVAMSLAASRVSPGSATQSVANILEEVAHER